jgi:GAF domain-containing protein
MFDVPMCYVGLIDKEEEQFLACHGTDFDTIERKQTICSYAIITDDVMVVDDVKNDPRFQDMESIQQLDINWYASAPIIVDGHRIGTFCIADTNQHTLSDEDKQRLRKLADQFATKLIQHGR